VKIKRHEWQHIMKSFSLENLVFIDESGVQKNMTRLYGRIIGGERLREATPGGHWDTTTIMSSIRLDGTITAMTLPGATDTSAFYAYVAEILCPTLGKNDIVIMDNLSSHKGNEIRRAIESTGANLVFLPPYSPDYNPIEMMWSKIKTLLRKTKARTTAALDEAISTALATVTMSDIHSWFESCGYVLIKT